MSTSYVLAPANETIRNTPIITLDGNNSVVLTDSIGRQTVVSLSQTTPTYNYIPPGAVLTSLPSILPSRYEYQDINEDSDLQQKVMRKIYVNFYNFIVPNQYPYLLNYVKMGKNGTLSMVKNKKEYKENKTKEAEYQSKIKYMSENVYAKSTMYKDVKDYLNTYDVKWYDIDDNKKEIYDVLINSLKRKLSDLIR